MNRDLRASLTELAETLTAQSALGPVEPILARRRRRRAVRRTAGTVGSLVVVGVLALGGTTLVQRTDEPVPATTDTPTGSPTPTPTPTPTAETLALPVGDPSLPFGTCGSLTSSAPASPPDEDLEVTLVVDSPSIEAGGPVTVRAVTEIAPSATVDAGWWVEDAQGPTFAVTHEGVVVAVADLYRGAPRTTVLGGYDPHASRFSAGALTVSICRPGATSLAPVVDAPLPAGSYELHALATVTRVPAPYGDAQAVLDGTTPEALAAANPTGARTVRSVPVPFTVVGTASTVALGSEPAPGTFDATFAEEPVCGGPAPTSTGPAGLFRIEAPADAVTLRADDVNQGVVPVLPSDPTFRYVGPGRVRLAWEWIGTYWFVQDGVVVGSATFPGDTLRTSLDLGRGDTPVAWFDHQPWFTHSYVTCGTAGVYPDDGVDLAPGTYEVFPAQAVSEVAVTTFDGVPLEGSASGLVIGNPVTVTLTE